MKKKKIISVKKLVKRYKKTDHNAVDNISFSVFEGEFFSLLGPNGAGKTTIISILTTTLSKTSGSVQIVGYDIEKDSNKVREKIGVIFQKPSLDLNLTAEENVRFHTILYGMYQYKPAYSLMPADYKNRIETLSKLLGINKEIFKPIKTFSGGMRRKLEIIRGLMHKPKILFLDEPTAGLDPESRRNLWKYLQGVRKEHKTTIFLTTHYLDEAEDADRICIIKKGKIVALGTPGQIKQQIIKDYIIIDSKNRERLQKELKHKQYSFSIEKKFYVQLEGKPPQKVIQDIRTPLTSLQINTLTLEDAYLEIIENSEKH